MRRSTLLWSMMIREEEEEDELAVMGTKLLYRRLEEKGACVHVGGGGC